MASAVPRRDERGQLAKPGGAAAEWRERAVGRLTELRGELMRARDAAERDERRLPDVLRCSLARFLGAAFDVEQIVGDLERKPEVLRERGERLDRVGIGSRDHGARDRGRVEERTR